MSKNQKREIVKEPKKRKVSKLSVAFVVLALIGAGASIFFMGKVNSIPVRQNVSVDLSQNENQFFNFSGSSVTVDLGSPMSNVNSALNELKLSTTPTFYGPFDLSELIATSYTGEPVVALLFPNQSDAYNMIDYTTSYGTQISLLSAERNIDPYVMSVLGQYEYGNLQLSNAQNNETVVGSYTFNHNYHSQLQNGTALISDVVSPYLLDLNSSHRNSSNEERQYLTINLNSNSGRQAIFSLNFSIYASLGTFIQNGYFGNVTYDPVIMLSDFNELEAKFICYGVNIQVPYNFANLLSINSGYLPAPEVSTNATNVSITDSSGNTTLLNHGIDLSTPGSVRILESGYYQNSTSKLDLGYFIQANDAMITYNGSALYIDKSFALGFQDRTWMSLLAGSLISAGVGEGFNIIRRLFRS